MLGVTDYQSDIERRQITRLIDLGVDGLVVTPSGALGLPASGDQANYQLLAEADVPVVIMERDLPDASAGLPLGGVRTDHAYGSMRAVRHLIDSGRTRIALIAPARGATSDLLRAGFRSTMAELMPAAPVLDFVLEGAENTAQLRDSAESILDSCVEQGVDGMLILPDAVAIAIADSALDRGIAVPDVLSIVAYDDEIASLAPLPLTAVSPPKFDVGAVAVRTCVELLGQRDGAGRLPALARVLLLPSLIVRSSSMPR